MSLQRIIWLASFPKSGNTWLRYLLAQYFMQKEQAPDINQISRFTTSDARQDIYDRVAGRRFEGGTFDGQGRRRDEGREQSQHEGHRQGRRGKDEKA